MADLERTYNVPLRKGAMKAPRYMRASKAVRELREFLQKHMKSKDVRIGPYLNSKILEHGRKNIPHHVEVKAIKDKDGIVKAELLAAKNLDFLMPKKEKEEEVKLKIPGMGKKKIEPVGEKKEETEKEKKEILEHKGKPLSTQGEKIPEIKVKDKEKEIMGKEERVYGRLKGKKTKAKERSRKEKNE